MSSKLINPWTAVIVLGGAFFVGALAAPTVQPAGTATSTAAGATAGAGATPSAKPSPSPTPKVLTFSPGQPGSPGKVATALKVADTQFGTIVVSDAGAAVYMSDSDSQTPPTSVCYNACTAKWIPLLTSGSVELDKSIPADVVGSMPRWDGGTQLTLRSWPLYLYVNDTRPGEVNGHDKVKHWQVLTPEGRPVP